VTRSMEGFRFHQTDEIVFCHAYYVRGSVADLVYHNRASFTESSLHTRLHNKHFVQSNRKLLTSRRPPNMRGSCRAAERFAGAPCVQLLLVKRMQLRKRTDKLCGPVETRSAFTHMIKDF
jgi:hypothetical protein